MNRNFDIIVVGAGPAGMAAACVAAERGKRVAIVDDNFGYGGQIWRGERPTRTKGSSDSPAYWFQRLRSSDSITQFFQCRVYGAPATGVLRAEQGGECIELGYERFILATGARERFLPFPGWVLPNVMGAGGLQAMVRSGLPIQDKRVVVAGSGPLLLAVAAYLREHGANVVAICEQAPWSSLARFAVGITANPSKLMQALHYGSKTFSIPFRAGWWPVAAHGETKLQSVVMSNGTKQRELPCDYLACSFHLVPNIELAMLFGCRIDGGFVAVDSLQRTSIDTIFCAGEPTGIGGLELSLLEGQIAGLASAGDQAGAKILARRRSKMLRFAVGLSRTFALRSELKSLPQPDTIVCRCEDVPSELISQHTSWRSAKLHTRCGMGPCQGRICGTALEFLKGWNVDSVRPPIFPVQMTSLAACSKNFTHHTTNTQETPCSGTA
ncbi:MAG TPA: FAD/NAD(P)-binding oxidoreductase [Acidobacteriaceae bacterium]|jgi:NADPH-dependent 2,4-dienoyl-CoA reductase/sulfur reductase-like enzyme|nr:FAD/NAD(P)-binding oxidoreductase [Acidobacteriaceae bacterium]